MIDNTAGPIAKKTKSPSIKRKIIRRLVTEGTIIVIAAGALLAVSLIFAGITNDEKKKAAQSETDVLQLNGKLAALKIQMSQFAVALPVSKTILDEDGNSTLNLSRDEASLLFLKLQEKYVLSNIRVAISPIAVSDNADLKKPRAEVIVSTINVDMEAYTDEQVMAYIKDVVTELPGVISVDLLEISRGSPYSLASGATAEEEPASYSQPQVTAKIRFVWQGLSIKADEKKADGKS